MRLNSVWNLGLVGCHKKSFYLVLAIFEIMTRLTDLLIAYVSNSLILDSMRCLHT